MGRILSDGRQMRVLFPDVRKGGMGKGSFLLKLAVALQKQSVEIVWGDGDHDVVLANIRIKTNSKKPIILRLDGCYYNTAQDWEGKNKGIAAACRRADVIINQSHHGEYLTSKYLGYDKKKSVVIYNGSNILVGTTTKNKNDFIFTASKWRPHKRLNDIIESFILADTGMSLIIAGDVSGAGEIIRYRPDVIPRGQMANEDVIAHFLQAKCSVHICYGDCCPNTVVESICCGCPVVGNNIGGTAELLRLAGGTIVNLDKETDFSPCDLWHPPKIDRKLLADAIVKTIQEPPAINSSFFDINKTAERYRKVMEGLI